MTRRPSSVAQTAPVGPDAVVRRPLRSRRHRAAGIALGLGAFTMGVAETIHPRGGPDGPGGLLQAFAAAPGTWTAWALLLMATSLLQLPGVLAWRARRDTGRGARFVGAAGLVLAGGLVALFAFGQSHGEGVALAGSEPIDPALVAAYTRADSSAALGVGLVLALFGFHLGWALLFPALARAGVLSVPVACAGVIGALSPLPLSGVSSLAETIGFWLLAAVIGWLGVLLVRDAGTDAGDRRPAAG